MLRPVSIRKLRARLVSGLSCGQSRLLARTLFYMICFGNNNLKTKRKMRTGIKKKLFFQKVFKSINRTDYNIAT